MSYYDYDKFVHPVPAGCVTPEGTQVQLVNMSTEYTDVVFFTTLDDLKAPSWNKLKYFLDYDITRPELPEEINSVIYNVHSNGGEYPVAVHQGGHIWSAFSAHGNRTTLYSPEIESFDTTSPLADRYAANEAKQREAAKA